MTCDLTPIPRSQRDLLRHLWQLYVYDFSEFMNWNVSWQGQFPENDLDDCWVNPRRHQFLIDVDGHPAGFVLIDRLDRGHLSSRGPVMDLREFFVLRAYRRRGVGTTAATRAFDLFHGTWEVVELAENVAAQHFWRRVIGAYSGGRYSERPIAHGDMRGIMQTFDNTI